MTVEIIQVAPSKNPEQESKLFSILGLAFGAVSLIIWFAAIAGLAFLLERLFNLKELKIRTT